MFQVIPSNSIPPRIVKFTVVAWCLCCHGSSLSMGMSRVTFFLRAGIEPETCSAAAKRSTTTPNAPSIYLRIVGFPSYILGMLWQIAVKCIYLVFKRLLKLQCINKQAYFITASAHTCLIGTLINSVIPQATPVPLRFPVLD